MGLPLKIRLLLWYINKDETLQFQNFTAAEVRENTERKKSGFNRFLVYEPVELFHVFNQRIAVRDAEIMVRIYQPTAAENLPIIMYFHGGGFVLSSIDSHDNTCRRIARDNKCIVISVDYRLAPEHKFPIPVHDCYDATVWASENAGIHKGDPSRLVVMGDSAGGSLSAAVSLMARDLSGPDIIYQILIYPCTDGTLSCASVDKYGKGYLLTKDMMQWFVNHYQSKKEDLQSPYLSMMLAEDLSNLPPAFVFTAEYDPLKDEGRKYAERMKAAGNDVIYKDYAGLIHGFITMPKLSKRILGVFDDIQYVLSKVLL